jgi:Mg-chelatase subunit ChlD
MRRLALAVVGLVSLAATLPGAPAPPLPPDDLGLNVALAAFGGHVVSPAAGKDKRWAPANLVDGFAVIRGGGNIETSFGWRPDAPGFPQELVFAFRDEREATIAGVTIDTATGDASRDVKVIPKDVEVWVSQTSASEGFTRVAAASLEAETKEQLLAFTPVRARYVKLVILGTHGKAPPQLGELQIHEAGSGPSIVADLPKNLLLPALGGSIVQFSSQYSSGVAAELIDGKADYESGWTSDTGPLGPATHVPQEFTFAFRDHRSAFIDRIVLDPRSGMRLYTGPRPATRFWAKSIELLASDTSARSGFTPIGTYAIPAEPKPVVVPTGRAMRFLKLRILESYGGPRTTFGEVQAIEGKGPQDASILMGPSQPIARAADVKVPGGETAARREREPNNALAQAESLDSGVAVGGGLTPAGDQDFFLLKSTATERQAVTVDIEGQPTIRTRVGVLDQKGRLRFEWDPSRAVGARARFSLLTDPGDIVLRMTQPPGAQVVVWDTSGSMQGRTKELDVALRQYLNQVQPGDAVNLVRFDDTVEVLLKEFTSDRSTLTAALRNKVYAGGGTAIYDAVTKAVGLLEGVTGHRAIVLMTDGEDLSSRTPPAAFWRAIQQEQVHVYAIGLGSGLRSFVAPAGATAARVLANTALSTGGRYLYANEPQQLASFYQQIAEELHAPPTYAIAARASAAVGTVTVKAVGERLASVSAPQQVELILDASGSMRRRIGAKSMMDIARDVLTNVVRGLPDDTQVALRIYGQRVAEGRPGDCEDSRLAVPLGKLDRQRLLTQIAGAQALGTTPIAYSIEAAAADFGTRPGPKMIIVVTDGKEECGGNPEAAAAKLREKGMDVTLNIVGFGLTSDADRDAMTKVSAAGGGRYFSARDGSALRSALEQAMAVPYDVVDTAGEVVGTGVTGTGVQVPEGVYTVRVQSAGAPVTAEHVAVVANQVTTVELKKDGQQVGIKVVAPASPSGKGQQR